MIDCTRTRDDEKKFIPDDEVYFIDGFLYIITRTYVEGKDWGNDVKYGIKVECLCAEYDDPITLKDIETRYEIMREQMLRTDYVPLYQQIVLNIVDEYAELHQDDMQEWCK